MAGLDEMDQMMKFMVDQIIRLIDFQKQNQTNGNHKQSWAWKKLCTTVKPCTLASGIKMI